MGRRAQNLYIIEVMMNADCKMEYFMAWDIAKKLAGYPGASLANTIDEVEDDHALLVFRSAILPGAMIELAKKLLDDYKYLGVYYIDMKYSYPYDINADRTVLWADGIEQEYTGRIEWTEDK